MNKLYIDNSSRYNSERVAYIVDEKGKIRKFEEYYPKFSKIYVASSPLEIHTIPTKNAEIVKRADTGDIIFTFTNTTDVVVVKNDELKKLIKEDLATLAAKQTKLETEAKYANCEVNCF